MTLTLSQAQAWRPETVQAVAANLQEKLGALGETLDAAKTATNKAAGASSGTGEEARFDFVDRATAHGWAKHGQIAQLRQAIDEAGYGLIGAHGRLVTAVEAAARDGLKVWNDGSVSGYDEAQAAKHAQAIGQALADLEDADNEHGQKIGAIAQLIGGKTEQRGASGPAGGAKQEPAPPPPEKKWKYTPDDLYEGGRDGRPSDEDVQQNNIGDCYLDADMMALASQDPGKAKKILAGFDPETGDFLVNLYKDGKPVQIRVGQQDIDKDMHIGSDFNGASRRDDQIAAGLTPDAPIWPAVVEAAYAQLHKNDPMQTGDSHAVSTIEHGFEAIGHGGWPEQAHATLTNQSSSQMEHGNWVQTHLMPDRYSTDDIYNRTQAALANHQPVTLSTLPHEHTRDDGLQNGHAYEVKQVFEDRGVKYVTLRNPWHTNENVYHEENQSVHEPYPANQFNRDPANPEITVPLQDLIDNGGYGYINTGG